MKSQPDEAQVAAIEERYRSLKEACAREDEKLKKAALRCEQEIEAARAEIASLEGRLGPAENRSAKEEAEEKWTIKTGMLRTKRDARMKLRYKEFVALMEMRRIAPRFQEERFRELLTAGFASPLCLEDFEGEAVTDAMLFCAVPECHHLVGELLETSSAALLLCDKFKKQILAAVLLPPCLEERLKRLNLGVDCGWAKTGEFLTIAITDDQLEERGRGAIRLSEYLRERIWERVAYGRTESLACSEHTVDLTIHADLMHKPWSDCIRGVNTMAYGSDQFFQGAVTQVVVFEIVKRKVLRLNLKPDSMLVWFAQANCFLAMHSEHKVRAQSDFLKTIRIALAQFYILQHVQDLEEIVVPFMTIANGIVSLFVLVWSPEGPAWHRIKDWNVWETREATALCAAMYRLGDWCRAQCEVFGGKMPEKLLNVKLVGVYEKTEEKSKSASGQEKKSKSDGQEEPTPPAGVVDGSRKKVVACIKEVVSAAIQPFRDSDEGPWHYLVPEKRQWVKLFPHDMRERGINEANKLALLKEFGVRGVPMLHSYSDKGEFVVVVSEDCGAAVRRVESWAKLHQHAFELLEVLAEIHRYDLVHGDVKESNLCAREGEWLKLIDWEGAVQGGSFPGRYSDKYRAPETLGKDGRFYPKSDVYSAGVVIRNWIRQLPSNEDERKWNRVVEHLTLENIDQRWDAEEALKQLRDAPKEDSPDKDKAGEVAAKD